MLNRTKNQTGVSLIESMVALVVISVGLLGIAALQLTAMSQNASSLHHSQAVWIAYNMSDRIRANVSQFNNYDAIDTDNAVTDPNCMANRCSNAQMINADAAEWKTMMDALPGGRGLIALTGTELIIKVMWDDEGTGAGGTDCGADPDIDLTCYTVALSQ